MVDGTVRMRQLVPERNDGREVRDLFGEIGLMVSDNAECLTDDLKLSLDRGAQESVGGVVVDDV
jgi:hypothetical protein